MMRKLQLLVLSLFLTTSVFAQDGLLTGQVTDAESGDPLIGATIYINSLDKGAQTDINGLYTIENLVEGTYEISYSYVGYEQQVLDVDIRSGENTLNISLTPSTELLDELVVTGYGTLQKTEISGSVSSINMDELADVPVQSFDQAIQGLASGVQVTNSSGAPGSAVQIRVRGQGSVNAGNDPLYIVDGVQVNSGNFSNSAPSNNVLSSLNASDIESISILKDAAAASIYGARAANGVVIINTKRGKAGETQFNLRARTGFQEIIREIPVINSAQLIELTRESLENYGFTPGIIDPFMTSTLGATQPGEATVSTNWADEYFRKGFGQSYNLSANGGNEKTRFFISGGFDSQEGQVIASDFQRLSLQTNIDHDATDRLAFDLSVNLSSSEMNSLPDAGAFASPYRAGILTLPTETVRDENGNYVDEFQGTYYFNTVRDADYNINESKTKRLIGSIGADYQITENITFSSNNAMDYFTVNDMDYWDPRSGDGIGYNGLNYRSLTEYVNFTTSQVLNFEYDLSQRNNLSGIVGFEYRNQTSEEFDATATNFPSYQFQNQSSAATYFGDPRQVKSRFRSAGYFGRVNYTFDDKYIVTATARYDGSSRFGENNKYGFFPAASAAWRVTREEFMESLSFVNDLKLRVGVGVTGNDAINNFTSRGLYSGGANYGGNPGLSPVQVANPDLAWEEATTYNYGVDYALFEGRIAGTVEYFIENTENLLFDRRIPGTTGFVEITQNVGSVKNSGIEIALNTINVQRNNFIWQTDFNITFLKNEVTGLFDDLEQLGTDLFVGEPIGVFFVNQYAGVNPADGRPMWYDLGGNVTYTRSPDDRVIVGSEQPDNFGGLNNILSYKGVSIETFFQWSVGNYLQHTDRFFGERVGNTVDRNQWATVLDRWRAPGDVTSVPKTIYLNSYGQRFDGTRVNDGASTYYTVGSSHFIEDASYLRLKRAKVGYNFNDSVLEKVGLRSMNIYAQGTNLITWTKFTGYDPEVTGASTYGVYPQGKTFTFGVNIGF